MANNNAQQVMEYWVKHDIRRTSLAKGLQLFERALRHNQTRGVFTFIGDAGVGKTQGIHAIARKHGRRIIDFRTAQFGLLSAGVPQRAEGDHFKIAVPDNMPKPGEKTVLLFDEINQGTPAAIAMFFQLLEDRRLYNYELPEETMIVALMNPATADYAVSRIESNAALNRRLKKFYVYSTFADWMKHAETDAFHYTDGMSQPCHPVIRRFLSATPSALYDDKARGLGKQFASPATWQTVSLDFYTLSEDNIKLDSDDALTLVSGSIGNTMAESLINYIRNKETMVSALEVLTGYSPDSKVRAAVLAALAEGGGEVVRLQEEVPTVLISKKPPAYEVADNFALFIKDLAEVAPARADALYAHLRSVALEEGSGEIDANREYLKEINLKLRHNENYRAVHEMFSQLHAEMTDPDSTETDPMA